MDNKNLAINYLKLLQKFGEISSPEKVSKMIRGSNLILKYLSDNTNKDITPGDISLELNVSTARVATALNMLEDKGFILRTVDENDKRRFLVSLTVEGINETSRIKTKVLNEVTTVFDLIGNEDAMEFVRISKSIYDQLIIKFQEEEE